MKHIIAVLAVALLLGTNGYSQTPQVLHFDNGAEPEHLDPGLVNDTTSLHLTVNLFEGLTAFHPRTLEPIPGVASTWKISPDGKTYTFTLRKDAKWSDGKPVVAQDFVYAWTRVIDPKFASRAAANLYPIKGAQDFNQGKITDPNQVGIKAVGDDQLVVTLQSPFPPFLSSISNPAFAPVRKDVVEAHGDKWIRVENMVNNGPFIMTEWASNKHIILKKNPHYWDAKHTYLDEAIFTPTEDHVTASKLISSQQIDYMEAIPSSVVEQFKGRPEYAITPNFSIYYYIINCKHPVLKDVRVRQALSYAIDRNALVNQYLKGLKKAPTHGIMPDGVEGYPYMERETFNVEKAKALLAEAGYQDITKFPTLQLIYNTNEDHKLIAEVVQQMWRSNLGINATIQNLEWKVLLKQLQNHQFEITRLGNVGEYVYPAPMLEVFLTGNESNFGEFSNAKYDALWKQAAMTANSVQRLKIYSQMDAILMDEMPAIPLYYYTTTSLLQTWVKGFFRNILFINPLKWVWIVPHDQTNRLWDTVLEYTRIPIAKWKS